MMGILADKGGKRFGTDRRVFTKSMFTVERRSGIERRSGRDRRRSSKPRVKLLKERRLAFKVLSTHKFVTKR